MHTVGEEHLRKKRVKNTKMGSCSVAFEIKQGDWGTWGRGSEYKSVGDECGKGAGAR